jgi:hypothetical protein
MTIHRNRKAGHLGLLLAAAACLGGMIVSQPAMAQTPQLILQPFLTERNSANCGAPGQNRCPQDDTNLNTRGVGYRNTLTSVNLRSIQLVARREGVSL